MKRKKKDILIRVGYAWYRAEQWERLRDVSADRDNLEESFEEWVELAARRYEKMRREGLRLQKVDVEELLKWCKGRGIPVDASARSEFAAHKLRERYESRK